MGSILKWLFRIILVAAALSLIALVAFYFILTRSIPSYNSDEPIEYGEYQVEILRDLQAVPHIYGEEFEDALFALGFAHAQDRLWQMEANRRAVQGRLSEFFGEQTLPLDKFFRSLNIWNISDQAVGALPEDELAWLQAYSDGVNAYIEDVNAHNRGSASPEFLVFGRSISPWTPTDSVALMKYFAFLTTNQAENEILRAKLAVQLSPEDMNDLFYDVKLPANYDRLSYKNQQVSNYQDNAFAHIFGVLKDGVGGASNAFVVAPKRSASQTAILGNDPHLELSAPSVWMLAHLHINANNQNIYGASFPGIPAILVGRNDSLAWGMTSSNLDDQDLVILNRVQDGYRSPEGVAPIERAQIGISVKGEDEVVGFVRESTPYGPIIPFGGPWKVEEIVPEHGAVALSWTALQTQDQSVSSAMKLMRSPDVNSAISALESFIAPSQVFSLADAKGHIAQFAAGLMPIRAENNPSKGTMPAPNWLDGVGFESYLPIASNPRILDPEDALLIHTNNKFIDAPYPFHWSYNWGDVYRRLRAAELLGTRKYHTKASFSEAQNDSISDAARVLLPLMARNMWYQPDQSEDKADALEMLANWNGEFDALQPEPLIFAAWLEELNAIMFEDELGNLYSDLGRVDPLRLERIFRNVGGSSRWCDIKPTPEVETCAVIAEISFERALTSLKEKYGSNVGEWRWGRAHHAVHKNPFLSQIPVFGGLTNIIQEQSGDTQTLLALSYPGGTDLDFNADHGPGLRMVVDFSDLDHSSIIIATGQSGHILSPHYDDLSTLWRAGEYIQMNTNRQVIEGNLEGRIEFVPEGHSDAEAE